jgi:phosphoribosylamine-glycine ligase
MTLMGTDTMTTNNVKLISKYGDGLGIAFRIANEGNDVCFWIKDPKYRGIYKGILKETNSIIENMSKDSNVIFDMSSMGEIYEKLSKRCNCYGAGLLQDKMEEDREFGIVLAEKSGLEILEHHEFKSFEDARKFLVSSKKLWVFKPMGDDNGFTYSDSEDTQDLIEMLDYFEGRWKGKVDFLLQEKVIGYEISTELWFVDGHPIMETLNSTWETKRFMTDELGQQTGCSSSIVKFWNGKEPLIYKETIKKMLSALKIDKYNGPLDVNTMVTDKKDVYFLEFTPRIGYSAIYAFLEGLDIKVGEFFKSLCEGKKPKINPTSDWLGSIRISIPPYPFEPKDFNVTNKFNQNIPIRGIDSFEHIWLLDVNLEDNKLVSSGHLGIICEVTGKNKTLKGLEKDIYGLIDKLKIPNIQYRTDAITVIEDEINKLQQLGFI